MDQWVIAAIALIGIVGQWIVGSRASARRDGVIDERLGSCAARLDKHGREIDDLRSAAAEDRGRIVAVETEIKRGRPRGC